MSPLPLLAALLAASTVHALPFGNGGQVVLAPTRAPTAADHPLAIHNELDPLRHLSAISPFFSPVDEPTAVPQGCKVERATVLVRHSAIYANDDEWYDEMQPLVEKLASLPDDAFPDRADKAHPWAFLRSYDSPITEKVLEKLSPKGEKDAKKFGQDQRKQYEHLFPSRDHGKKHRKGDSGAEKPPKTPYKLWTASSERDITSARSFIKGAFPSHQSGDDGEGNGDAVRLIEVPNKARDWDRSLTPHKSCDAFEKESSKVPAGEWLAVFGRRVRSRLADGVLPGVGWMENSDVLGMMMLCGYESIIRGSSPFCSVFTDEEWLDFEYYMDVRYHYMMGYGQSLAPYLGIPWVSTAAHLLAGAEADDERHEGPAAGFKHKEKPLPTPKLPPNGTHTQLSSYFLTHRESPAFVAVALNLYNVTTPSSDPPSSVPPALDVRPPGRSWKTSELVPFLGNVALERLSCGPDAEQEGDFVRVLVNGKGESMGGCQGGPGDACPFDRFQEWVEARKQRWSGWEAVCDKPKEL